MEKNYNTLYTSFYNNAKHTLEMCAKYVYIYAYIIFFVQNKWSTRKP